jgi:glycosyltransferase involved in cell wall biosynthesis
MTSESADVSVLLPAYNGQRSIERAINSILSQTLSDFQLVIVDDGSSDETWKVVQSFDDPRILALRHEANAGLVQALSTGLRHCKGRFIARHDQDDVSMPDRLSVQREFLLEHPGVVLVGTWASVVGGGDSSPLKAVARLHHPWRDPGIRLMMTWNNPFVHGSVMIRSSALEASGGYSTDRDLTPPEDYELWTRLASHGELRNIRQELLVYHQSAGGMSATMAVEMETKAHRIALKAIRNLLGRQNQRIDSAAVCILNGSPYPKARWGDYFRVDALVVRMALRIRTVGGHTPLRQAIKAMLTCHRVQVRQLLGR